MSKSIEYEEDLDENQTDDFIWNKEINDEIDENSFEYSDKITFPNQSWYNSQIKVSQIEGMYWLLHLVDKSPLGAHKILEIGSSEVYFPFKPYPTQIEYMTQGK
jgi:hypothetical protein